MKARVLVYASTSDKVIGKFKELTPMAENVYSMLVEEDEYGNNRHDTFGIVFAISGVYFCAGDVSRSFIEDPSNRSKVIAIRNNWLNTVKEKATQQLFISLMEIKVFEMLGEDTTPLLQAREYSIKKREQEAEEQAKRYEIQKEEKRQKEQARLDECKQKLLNGGQIRGTDFVMIANRDGFEIHIRTKGTLINSVNWLNRDGRIAYTKYKGQRVPNFQGCCCAIDAYVSFVENNQSQ